MFRTAPSRRTRSTCAPMIRYGDGLPSSGRSRDAVSPVSSVLVIAATVDADTLAPHRVSTIVLTFRVDTSYTYI